MRVNFLDFKFKLETFGGKFCLWKVCREAREDSSRSRKAGEHG